MGRGELVTTTRTVREVYCDVAEYSGEMRELLEADFDAWLTEYRDSIIQEVHDQVRLIPCYGKGGVMEFDIGPNARGQVLDVILELKGES